jgi:hypothetical protein
VLGSVMRFLCSASVLLVLVDVSPNRPSDFLHMCSYFNRSLTVASDPMSVEEYLKPLLNTNTGLNRASRRLLGHSAQHADWRE